MNIKDKKIVFMGTPEFAVESLKALYEEGFNISAVITAPDKPAGRGQKISKSAVKIFAEQKNLKILQPEKLKSPEFIEELKEIKPDLQIVVAFRMLPQAVWEMPPYGTVNLHASLLPDYRGAAPINYAIINGEKLTGLTTFFIDKEIDTGRIIKQKEVELLETYTAGDLHDILMCRGAKLIVETVNDIFSEKVKTISQPDMLKGRKAKIAPKVFVEHCYINWQGELESIYNHIRGLSPQPTARTTLLDINNNRKQFKIFKAIKIIEKHNFAVGDIISDNKKFMKIAVNHGFISLTEVQLEGKKRMDIKAFLNGLNISEYKIFVQ